MPVSRQLSVALVVSYPVSQTREALDPYVVVVNVTFPLLTLKEEPQSEKYYRVITCNKKLFKRRKHVKRLKQNSWYIKLSFNVKNYKQCAYVTFRTVHLIREKMCKRPDSLVGRIAERYSEGPWFESRSSCSFLSPCDTNMAFEFS
jgi:hypothetical protein